MLWQDPDVVTSRNKSNGENKTLYWIIKQLSFKIIKVLLFCFFLLNMQPSILSSCFLPTALTKKNRNARGDATVGTVILTIESIVWHTNIFKSNEIFLAKIVMQQRIDIMNYFILQNLSKYMLLFLKKLNINHSENKSTDSVFSKTAVEARECSENYWTNFWNKASEFLTRLYSYVYFKVLK